MPRRLGILVALVCWGVAEARGADDPRALVARAIDAVGGRKLLEQRLASISRVKGKIQPEGPGGDAFAVEGAVFSEPGGRSRLNLQFEVAGAKHDAVIVLDGPRSWRAIDGEVTPYGADEVKALDASAYRDRVSGLVALLDDKSFALEPLAEAKILGRPAAGVKVSSKGQPDMSLYFDRETGFLVKYSYRGKDPEDPKEALREMVLADYRAPGLGLTEEQTLREAKVDTGGPALVELLRRQAQEPGRVEKVRALIRQLGDEAFAVREKASAELVALGPVALPFLQAAAKSSDREVARRAEQCLQQIGEHTGSKNTILAVRLVGMRRPAGAAEALLNLLPGADPELAREIKAALFAVAGADKAVDPALTRALTDKDPARRAAAAAVLGKDGGAYLREPRRRIYLGLPKQANRTLHYVDGKLTMELASTEWEFFNRFEDRDFAKP
jgi:hypothetical protein